MVLERLGESLKSTLQKIAKAVFVDDRLVNELVKDIQRSLLQADVNVQLVFNLTKRIKERVLEEEAPGISKKEFLITVVYEELVRFLGGEAKKIEIAKKPTVIMLIGLFGSGKTTTAGKLGHYFANRGHKVCLVGLDVHRPAAMDQIEQVASDATLVTFIDRKEKDPVKIYRKFEHELMEFDVVILDTAGRDRLSSDLIEEIEKVREAVRPDERLLVISADIGQTSHAQVTQFHASCGLTGIIVTKMDGTARGGGALTACAVSGAPIKFIGVGEKLNDLESFNPKGFVGRLLGMGDLEELLEKAKVAMSEEEAQDLGQRFLKGEFTLIDLYEQMQAMKKMGSLRKLVEMIPGFSQLQLPKEVLDVQEGKLGLWKTAMDSMNQNELENPEEIDAGRIERISKGSGVSAQNIRELVKQYKQGKKMAKMMKGSTDMGKMMKKLGGMKNMRFG